MRIVCLNIEKQILLCLQIFGILKVGTGHLKWYLPNFPVGLSDEIFSELSPHVPQLSASIFGKFTIWRLFPLAPYKTTNLRLTECRNF